MSGQNGVEKVNLTIDGKRVSAAKGSTIIEAARSAGIEIPHYCYHPSLSIAGNCRICQVKVTGLPKLQIACHWQVAEGMEVFTHFTSEEVAAAQAATLEFILINHPLDCTVCDQSGHCKLQDYHFEYNARESRFIEDKVHKVKAEPLGPTVVLDGERCIMCTRCIRFCDEVTKTGELGMLNRGDRSVIAINPGKVLDNPLSGSVVDLCPVGALTHREWRFNSRIWFTKQTDSICPGCSTGCNVKVAERSGEVVHVKARLNLEVNKEWMCDEGRYGFKRYLPETRINAPLLADAKTDWDRALAEATKLKGAELLVFVSAELLLEEYALLKIFLDKFNPKREVAIAYRERELSQVQKILISPDYAPNFRGAEFSGLVSGDLEKGYTQALEKVKANQATNLLFVGERAVLCTDQDSAFCAGVAKATNSVGLFSDRAARIVSHLKVAFPGRSILEKSGLMLNRKNRLQFNERVVELQAGTEPEWRILNRIAEKCGAKLTQAAADRDLTLWYLGFEERLKGLKISAIKNGGISLVGQKAGEAGADESSLGAVAG